jgi:hypothetical protein
MSDHRSKKDFTSRLRQGGSRAPMMGVGSAIPENQRQAGALDPHRAAEEAADPDAARRSAEKRAVQEEKDNERRGELLQAWEDQLIFKDVEDQETVITHLKEASSGQLIRWLDEVADERKRQIDDEEEGAQHQSMMAMRLSEDDPSYMFMMDQELRKRIEKNLEPLDFAQMVFDGYAEQEVTLNPKLKVIYRTVSGTHALWMERKMHLAGQYAKQYGAHWFSMLQLAASIQMINDKEIGTDLNAFHKEDHEAKFWEHLQARLEKINRLPTEISDLLIANLAWFSGRVRKEMVGDLMEQVGNS